MIDFFFFTESKLRPCKQNYPVTLTINKTFAAELPKIDDVICFESNCFLRLATLF